MSFNDFATPVKCYLWANATLITRYPQRESLEFRSDIKAHVSKKVELHTALHLSRVYNPALQDITALALDFISCRRASELVMKADCFHKK